MCTYLDSSHMIYIMDPANGFVTVTKTSGGQYYYTSASSGVTFSLAGYGAKS